MKLRSLHDDLISKRAREAREAAQRLSRELGDRADILMRELEVAPPRSSNLVASV